MQGIGLLALQRANRAFKLSDVRGVQESTKQFGASQDEDQAEDEDYEGRRDLTYPGLLNTSTTCYLNSTLQSLASCPSFISYLNSLVKSSDVHLELTLSLLQMLRALNRPFKNGLVLKTNEILYSLMNSSSTGHAYKNRRRIMQGSGQQDAQEFFLILAETVEEEKKVLYKRVEEVRQEKVGLQELLLPIEILEIISRVGNDGALRNPFQSLMANRTSCVTCGYSEAIRHTHTENLTLNVPSARHCHLNSMLSEYTKLELIEEYTCRRCSIFATRNRIQEQVSSQKGSTESKTASKKKKIRELQRTLLRLEDIMDAHDFEADISDLPIKLDRAVGPASKQVMFSRAPQLLVIHLSRSSFFDGTFGYTQKNNCSVQFPEVLDMTPFTTTSELNMSGNHPISRTDPPQTSISSQVYALTALVVHIGNHHSGHYLTYRRRPGRSASKLSKDWYRISDEDVEPSSAEEVLRSNPFLLFYERTGASDESQNGPVLLPGLDAWRMISP